MKEKTLFSKRSYATVNASIVLSFSTLLMSNNVFAVESKPRKVGNMDVSSVITSSLGYGDNVFRGSQNETSSTFLSIKPTVEAVSETIDQKLTLGYEGEGVAFFDSSDDNYLSNQISGEFSRRLSKASEFSVGASFEDGSTVRGVDITEGSNGDVEGATDFTRTDFALGYAIGSPKIGPSLDINYNYTDLGFDNFELINQGRDYKLDKFSARLGYQYSVATKFFVDLSHSDFNYDEAARSVSGELDNSEKAILVGLSWRLNRLTTGEFSVGSVDKDFDNFQDPGSFTSWNAQLEWTPTARDTVTIESFSRPFEQAGTGLFQDVDQSSIEWARNISRTVTVKGGAIFGSVDFGTVARDDDYETFSLGVLYKPTRYSEWSLNYEYEDKDSNLSRFDFETNTVFLSYSVSL